MVATCGPAATSTAGRSLLYRLDPDLLTVRDSYPTPGHRPAGMCHDGRFLWLTDRDSGRLDRFDPEVREITRSTPTPGFSPCGLAWDGRHLWLTDVGTGQSVPLVGFAAGLERDRRPPAFPVARTSGAAGPRRAGPVDAAGRLPLAGAGADFVTGDLDRPAGPS